MDNRLTDTTMSTYGTLVFFCGISVVMDFPANTRKQRAWFRDIIEEKQYPHKLIHLEATDSLCLERLALRRQSHPERANFDTDDVFRLVTAYFEAPGSDESFKLETIRP